ncbi:MAG: tRNA-dihydrouridine synthase, partial [Pseudomonadota bacterium]
SRQVTGGKSGSALMQEPDLALRIIDAALEGAGGAPVTLKMRLGWDEGLLNAQDIGRAAQDRGIQLLTVHGRTRCQFYKGQADWGRIRDTVEQVDVPVIANGDINSVETANEALSQSGAYGVMVGRASMGQPWLVGEIAYALAGKEWEPPTLSQQLDSLSEQVEDSLNLYGKSLGLRIVRKHISAAIEKLDIPLEVQYRRKLRADLCRLEDPAQLLFQLRRAYERHEWEVAA